MEWSHSGTTAGPYVGRLAVAPDGGRWRANRTLAELAELADRLGQDDLMHRPSLPDLRRALPDLRQQLPEGLQPKRQDGWLTIC